MTEAVVSVEQEPRENGAPGPQPAGNIEESISQEALAAFAEVTPVAGGFSDVQRSHNAGALLSSLKRSA